MTVKIVKPIIAIPMGDPAGVGPEITVGALSKKEIYEQSRPIVVGHKEVLQKAIEIMDVSLTLNEVACPEEGTYEFGVIDVIHVPGLIVEDVQFGEVQAQCGQAAFDYIYKTVELANAGDVHVMATTPINKESLKAAEVPFIGHTEMLEALTNTDDPLTMFQVHNMRIFFLTRHLSVKDAIDQVTKERVRDYLNRCDKALQRLGVENRKFAVAGLNPHAGEGGLFGREEIDELNPGIELAQKDGIDVAGPVPADSVFHHALNGKFDAVLSLYHDQGHIAAKMTDFERTISITNGLPFLRTSVDHGTAFDIAGKGIASTVSMEECIKLAAKYASQFTRATV
ncbi:4-hydroxythreonine-4-phosphate dehydrogenase PdxA [Jeotgalibacillus marinus]|uniref:4-hydroxythreonine-4-phosphate dehydrogenase PdxA n=1 Tax=Jeotgalibacillus marinus TaxID=86667 RepID=A0ABV3Q4X5_9BACL